MRGDTSWTEADEPWKRLLFARAQTSFDTPTAFARACRIDVQKYLAMEGEPGRSRKRKLDADTAMKVARKTGLRWEWILTRDGQPWADEGDSPGTRVRTVLKGQLDDDQVEELARLADLFARTGTEG